MSEVHKREALVIDEVVIDDPADDRLPFADRRLCDEPQPDPWEKLDGQARIGPKVGPQLQLSKPVQVARRVSAPRETDAIRREHDRLGVRLQRAAIVADNVDIVGEPSGDCGRVGVEWRWHEFGRARRRSRHAKAALRHRLIDLCPLEAVKGTARAHAAGERGLVERSHTSIVTLHAVAIGLLLADANERAARPTLGEDRRRRR